MSSAKLSGKAAGFFWVGVVLTLTTITLVFAHNTQGGRPFEREHLPLLWVFGVLAAVAFLATELCESVSRRSSAANDQRPQPVPATDKVSKQEFLSYMETEFDRLDKDQSGKLDVNALRSTGSSKFGNLAVGRVTRND
jgi:hypothetical protein